MFVDLDDTLFRTKRKAKGPLGVPVTTTVDGDPSGYMSPTQQAFFARLSAMGTLIPATARTVASLRRVSLPLSPMAVCAGGAVILGADGTVDPEWDEHVATALASLSIAPDALAQRMGAPDIDVRVVHDAGRPVHLSLRHRRRDAAALAAHGARLEIPSDWRLEPHLHELMVRPSALGKAPAVRFLLAHRLPDAALKIGVGDRASDAEFMALCDYAITPTDSDLFGRVLDAATRRRST